MPKLYHFAKGLETQTTEEKAYGVKSKSEFRVTSSFNATNDATAYAMLPGIILLQPQTNNTNKVNLILKPTDLTSIKMPVKYIVYRGLRYDSFFATDGSVKTDADENSELLKELYKTQRERVPGGTAVTIPSETLLGVNDLTNIDDFFYQSDAPTQLFPVPGGMELGNFATGEVGIEIILENSDLDFTVDIAKKSAYKIEIANTDLNTAKGKWEKEQIRHFVDPAAFYGLHSDIKGGIGYRNDEDGNLTNTSSVQDVYDRIMYIFATRDRVYLDIRNENGYSYNYYGEYPPFKNKSGEEEPGKYYTNGWPIAIAVVENYDYHLEIPKPTKIEGTDSQLIVIGKYAQKVEKKKDDGSPHYDDVIKSNNQFLIDGIDFGDKEQIRFEVPYKTGINGIATTVRFDFIKKTDQPLNFIFGPVDTNIPWQGEAAIKWMKSNIDRYYYTDDTIAVLQSGMAVDTIKTDGSVEEKKCYTYYATSIANFISPVVTKNTYDFNFSGSGGGTEGTRSANFLTFFNRKTNAGIEKGDGILSFKKTGEVNAGNTFLLGISEEDKTKLLVNADFSKYRHKFFKLTKLSGANQYQLSVVEVDNSNNQIETLTINRIIVFSSDGKIFTSSAYQNAIDFQDPVGPTVHFRRPDDKLYDYGFDWMREGEKRDKSSEKSYLAEGEKAGLCESANIDGSSINDRTEAQNFLKNEYTPQLINGADYYVPWLCMRENVVDGVRLALHIEGDFSKKENITFVCSEGINMRIPLADKRVMSGKEVTVSVDLLPKKREIIVECNTSSAKDRIIEVISKYGQLIGKLNIYRNAKCIDDLSFKFIKVEFTGTLTALDKTLTFDNDNEKVRDNENYSQEYYYKGWEDKIINNEKHHESTKKFLNQCLIDYPSTEKITNEDSITISLDDDKLFVNRVELTGLETNPVTNFKQGVIKIIKTEDTTPVTAIKVDDFDNRVIGLLELTRLANSEKPREMAVFYFPLPIWIQSENDVARGLIDSNIITLNGIPSNISSNTMAHEITHCLGDLGEAFVVKDDIDSAINKKNKFMFTQHATENIMDYGNQITDLGTFNKLSFWKWQWEKILNNN